MNFSSFQLREEGLIQIFKNEITKSKNVEVNIARLDWIHPQFGGNKLFKLSPYLKIFQHQAHSSILSFGGPYSNHLFALAAVCKELNIPCVGIIRSSEIVTNKTIEALVNMGMKLVFISKSRFDHFAEKDKIEIIVENNLKPHTGQKPLWIDLGGEGPLGIQGASDIWPFLQKNHQELLSTIHQVYVAIGTGTTFLGLRKSIPSTIKCVGITVFKGGESYVENNFLLKPYKNDLLFEFAGRGFGKNESSELDLYDSWQKHHNLDLDIVYTGKSFTALLNQIASDKIPSSSNVLFVHTGGQQGNSTY